jgi:two-component system, NtrC family, sensor histidine kinase PilS
MAGNDAISVTGSLNRQERSKRREGLYLGLIGQIVAFLKAQRSDSGPEFRKRVEWLMFLRLMVTSLLLGSTIFCQLRESPEVSAEITLPLYILIATTFLLSIIYSLYLAVVPDLWILSFVQVMVDLVYGTVLVHFTGGATSVFTVLYVFPILTSGILHPRRGALFIASVASLLFGLLINLEFYGVIPHSRWPWVIPWSETTSFYVLWVLVVNITSFFLVAMLSSSFSEQLRETKASLTLKERAFERLSDLHTSIVRSITSGIITTDENDRISFINSAGAGLLQKPRSELIGEPLKSIFPGVYDGRAAQHRSTESFLTVKEIAGEPVHFDITVNDLQGGDGASRGRLVIFEDVTKIRRMEERVKLNEKQAAFVRIAAGMAHEIRNPLAALRGATEMLSTGFAAQETDRRLLGIVIRESDRLNTLLGDFLAMVSSRKPDKLRVMMTDLVEETLGLFSTEPKVGKTVSLQTLIKVGVEVEGDPARLRQAVWNLFANALDATQDGGYIRVVLEPDPNAGHAVLTVQDSGPGIPIEVKDRMFEPFTTTKEKGTGLGLSIVMSIVRDHGGTIEAESTPGKGTVFTMRLPLASQEAGVPK